MFTLVTYHHLLLSIGTAGVDSLGTTTKAAIDELGVCPTVSVSSEREGRSSPASFFVSFADTGRGVHTHFAPRAIP